MLRPLHKKSLSREQKQAIEFARVGWEEVKGVDMEIGSIGLGPRTAPFFSQFIGPSAHLPAAVEAGQLNGHSPGCEFDEDVVELIAVGEEHPGWRAAVGLDRSLRRVRRGITKEFGKASPSRPSSEGAG